jgi:UDP-GlcNAc3NAcA epimerase
VRVLTVIGNRPQFVKAAAVSTPLRRRADEVLVHTGQHYDDALSRVFVDELDVPAPDRELGVGGGSNTDQTARMLAALEPLVDEVQPDVVLVYGDTNSTLAGALVAAQAQRPLAHVEAGMRSFDRTMPEEVNRVVSDHLASLMLCSSETAAGNLRREGVAGEIAVVGDVMVDVALALQPRARARREPLAAHGLEPGRYLLATVHRPGTVDDPERMRRVVELLRAMPDPVVLPLHPRTHARLKAAGLDERLRAGSGVVLTGPLGYLDFAALLYHARAVLTDSGGVQKEAYLAGVPCLTLRERTEWVETVDLGWNVLVDIDARAARAALERPAPSEHPALYGDGKAGARVVAALERLLPS